MDIASYLADLRKHGRANDIPNISDETAQFLTDLIRISGTRDVLELGTANGYSTIRLALALQEIWGHITSIDYSLPSYNEAVQNIKDTKLQDTVTLIFGNALEELPKFSIELFDFLFIDAQKKRTLDFFQLAYPLVRPGWFIIIDDVIKFRFKMESFYEYLADHKIVHSILKIDEDDGVMMIVKPQNYH